MSRETDTLKKLRRMSFARLQGRERRLAKALRHLHQHGGDPGWEEELQDELRLLRSVLADRSD
jgi:hypothetical protein